MRQHIIINSKGKCIYSIFIFMLRLHIDVTTTPSTIGATIAQVFVEISQYLMHTQAFVYSPYFHKR